MTMRPWFLQFWVWNSFGCFLASAHKQRAQGTNHHRIIFVGRGNSLVAFNPGPVQFNKVQTGTEQHHLRPFSKRDQG
jgi:poly-gamma-glutamate capsule biosynthesis protein CapA/YwtB (metallophosphatase superfamily)